LTGAAWGDSSGAVLCGTPHARPGRQRKVV
jgi:hypothetical protein